MGVQCHSLCRGRVKAMQDWGQASFSKPGAWTSISELRGVDKFRGIEPLLRYWPCGDGLECLAKSKNFPGQHCNGLFALVLDTCIAVFFRSCVVTDLTYFRLQSAQGGAKVTTHKTNVQVSECFFRNLFEKACHKHTFNKLYNHTPYNSPIPVWDCWQSICLSSLIGRGAI